MTNYKQEKEAFVSGLTGSTFSHVNIISAAALFSIALHSVLVTRFKNTNLVTGWLVLVLPLLLSMTLLANHAAYLSMFLLALVGLSLLIPPQQSGTELPSSTGAIPPTPETSLPPLPALTTYRSHMLLMTVLAILAVDFPVFPRTLAKCETFGVSLMDIGVGSFVFSQGVVSAIPMIKNPTYLSSPLVPKVFMTLKKVLPILVIGLIRVLLVKGTDYPEHETEYGRHWNFFITMAVLPFFQVLLHPIIKNTTISFLALLFAVVQQNLLSTLRLQPYLLDAPRVDLFSANKEGIISLPGYLAIHLFGLSTGTLILPPSPSWFRHQQKSANTRPLARRRNSNDPNEEPSKSTYRQNDKTATELFSYAVIWWVLLGLVRFFDLDYGVSRRMANLSYILWVAAYNTTFILGYLLLDLIFFPSPLSKSIYSPKSKLKVTPDNNNFPHLLPGQRPVEGCPPALLEAINKNGLVFFLLANLATGLVNLSIPTMTTPDSVAMGVLSLYSFSMCAVAWVLRKRRIWKF